MLVNLHEISNNLTVVLAFFFSKYILKILSVYDIVISFLWLMYYVNEINFTIQWPRPVAMSNVMKIDARHFYKK